MSLEQQWRYSAWAVFEPQMSHWFYAQIVRCVQIIHFLNIFKQSQILRIQLWNKHINVWKPYFHEMLQYFSHSEFHTWKSPYLCDDVSIPVPITRPPTVKSSSSGRIGIVQPKLFKVLLNWPMVTRGSHFTVLLD